MKKVLVAEKILDGHMTNAEGTAALGLSARQVIAELLEEYEGLRLSSPSVRRILLEKGMKQSKERRRSKSYQPRKRKPQAGMLRQIDATPYAWLKDRAPRVYLTRSD
jgi:regulator of replication initiation timing